MDNRKTKITEAPIDGDGDGDLKSNPMPNRKRKRTKSPTSVEGDLELKRMANRKRKRKEAPTGGDGDGDLKHKPESRRRWKYQAKPKQTRDKMIASALGDNRIEDVKWLCSLSESELDMLICLKTMVLRRAETHPDLANKIDLKMLRDLSFTTMKNLKEELKKVHLPPSCDCEFAECWKQIDKSKLSQVDVEEKFPSMTNEELWPLIRPNLTHISTRDSSMYRPILAPARTHFPE